MGVSVSSKTNEAIFRRGRVVATRVVVTLYYLYYIEINFARVLYFLLGAALFDPDDALGWPCPPRRLDAPLYSDAKRRYRRVRDAESLLCFV
jgi:hypothetical protein